MRRPLRFRVRTLMVSVVVVSLLMAYVSSYYRLSRRGMREAEPIALGGILYISIAEWERTHDLSQHYSLMRFYAPLNYLDRQLFGRRGKHPIVCIMWRLSG